MTVTRHRAGTKAPESAAATAAAEAGYSLPGKGKGASREQPGPVKRAPERGEEGGGGESRPVPALRQCPGEEAARRGRPGGRRRRSPCPAPPPPAQRPGAPSRPAAPRPPTRGGGAARPELPRRETLPVPSRGGGGGGSPGPVLSSQLSPRPAPYLGAALGRALHSHLLPRVRQLRQGHLPRRVPAASALRLSHTEAGAARKAGRARDTPAGSSGGGGGASLRRLLPAAALRPSVRPSVGRSVPPPAPSPLPGGAARPPSPRPGPARRSGPGFRSQHGRPAPTCPTQRRLRVATAGRGYRRPGPSAAAGTGPGALRYAWAGGAGVWSAASTGDPGGSGGGGRNAG